MGVGSGAPARIPPESLNLDRSVPHGRRAYLLEERDRAGAWVERGRFGSQAEAGRALDGLPADARATVRIREVDPRRWLKIAVVVVLALSAAVVVGLLVA